MQSSQIRVVLADDHPVVRTGIDHTLEADAHITVVGTAATFAQLLLLLAQHAVEVVVLDLSGMGETPLAMVAQLTHRFPGVAIVAFSSSVDLAPELLEVGVRGYVAKEELSQRLIEAVHAAYAHQTYISPATQEYLDRSVTVRQRFRFTPQEFNVLKLIAQGRSTAEIAATLVIDEGSVYNYITAVRRKVGISSRTQLADFYRRLTGDEAGD